MLKLKILVGMSGGVDSTYAALKLLDEGHEVVGAVLVMHEYTEIDSAVVAAERVGIPLVKIDCTKPFEQAVKSYFSSEYAAGRTPNPCIVCNREVKFKYLAKYARENGFDRIATGHYARIVKTNDGYAVSRAVDSTKDQTYMLYRLPQDVLEILALPLSDEVKSDVKKKAEARGIIEPDVKESQEICFIPDNDYRSYIEEKLGKFPDGCFVDDNGRVIGKHRGIIGYTVGQRKGLGISLGQRAFVSRIDPKRNEVTLSTEKPITRVFAASDLVYSGIAPLEIGKSIRADVKIRYHAAPTSATVTAIGEGRVRIEIDDPKGLVAPGQSVVAYDNDIVLFGGFIDSESV